MWTARVGAGQGRILRTPAPRLRTRAAAAAAAAARPVLTARLLLCAGPGQSRVPDTQTREIIHPDTQGAGADFCTGIVVIQIIDYI